MKKKQKEFDKKKSLKSSKKSQAGNGKTHSGNEEKCCLTWVGIAYQCISIVRVVRGITDRAHPATYAKSAKDNLVMPIVKRNCSELTQTVVGGVTEIIEFVISPTRYILNIVSYTVAESTGEVIKKNYSISHPELRAGIDVVFSESAYQAVNKMSCWSGKQSGLLSFFGANNKLKCDNKTAINPPLISLAQSMRFRSKL